MRLVQKHEFAAVSDDDGNVTVGSIKYDSKTKKLTIVCDDVMYLPKEFVVTYGGKKPGVIVDRLLLLKHEEVWTAASALLELNVAPEMLAALQAVDVSQVHANIGGDVAEFCRFLLTSFFSQCPEGLRIEYVVPTKLMS